MTNQLVRVTIGGVASPYSGQVGLIAQTTADWNTNLLWVGTDTNGLIEVWTLTSGTWNGPIASGASGANYALARVLEANVNGTTLTVRMNGAIVSGLSAMAVPSAPVSASYAGMYIDTTGASWPTVIDFYVNSAN